MPAQTPEIRQFKGLYLQQNSFEVPDGALELASNVLISKDGIISKRRGYYQYFSPGSGTLNTLANYQNKVLAIYADKVRYYNDTGSSPNETGSEQTITAETGVTVAVTSPRIARKLQANDNLYFTTDNGVLKLTAYNSSIAKSGAPQALDLRASYTVGSTASFLSGGYTVGYRILFGRRDANDNLILSAPGDTTTISNTSFTAATYTSSGAGPYTVTVTTTSAHGWVTGQYVVVTGATDADANGTYAITVTGTTTFTYSTTNNPTSGTLNVTLAESVRLEFSVPSECSSTTQGWFYQVYRSSQQTSAILSDFKLITEHTLTSAELTAGVAFFTDDVDDILLGAELYTNENSREGELQANFRAPKCEDVALYKNFAVYANCTTRHLLELAVVDTTVIANGDILTIKVDATERPYIARTGVGNKTTRSESVSGGPTITVTSTAHGLVNGDVVYFSQIAGGTYADQAAVISGVAANTFQATLTGSGSPTSLYFQGLVDASSRGIFHLSSSSSASVRLLDTAQGLVKSINRDGSSLIYAQYISGANDVPGKMRFQAKGFTGVIYAKISNATAGTGFSPTVETTYGAVKSVNDSQPNVFYVGKQGEPEAVPLVNFFPVGSKNQEIQRVAALRDSLIIVKEDGVYRMTGDTVSNFTVTALDTTVHCVAPNSLDVINNQVVFLSNQGVCLVTESSVAIISRKIEDVIQPILGQANLSAQTAGIGYESERLYLLTTTEPNTTAASKVWAYNLLTDSWSSWDTLFSSAVLGPSDVLYYVGTNNKIYKERKKQNRVDFSGQNYTVTVSSVASDGESAVIVMPSGIIPEDGDIIVKDNVISHIDGVPTIVTTDTYAVSFNRLSNIAAADTPILYKGYVSEWKTAPFHAGLVGRSKQFGQMQAHFHDDSCSKLTIFFQGDTYAGSESVVWSSPVVRAGFCFFPFCFEPFGQPDGFNLPIGTSAAGICRIYVPRFQQRTSFLQPYFQHREAGEGIGLQALTFSVRPYAERVSK